MSKITIHKFILVIAIFTLCAFSILPQNTTAVLDCSFKFEADAVGSDKPPNTYMEDLFVTITSSGLPKTNDRYFMVIQDPGDYLAWVGSKGLLPTYKFEDIAGTGIGTTRGWQNKVYQAYLFRENLDYKSGLFGIIGKTDVAKEALCIGSFLVIVKPIQDQCQVRVTSQPIDPATDVTLQINNAALVNYKIKIEPQGSGTKKEFNVNINSSSANFQLGLLIEGTYTALLLKDDRLQCVPELFVVGPAGSNSGGRVDTGGSTSGKGCTEVAIKLGKCASGGGKEVAGCTNNVSNPGIATAIGCIHTNPVEFIKDFMTWVLGIGGGLSFLMMLMGAFQMMTSAGNPETLNAGKDRLTSAIIGLLMVIFAILLFQIIGWGILKIPGFG